MEVDFSRVIDALPGLVWTARTDGNIDFVNKRWCEYTGLSAGERLRCRVAGGDLPRKSARMSWLITAMVLLWILSAGMSTPWSLGMTAFLVGVSINSFSLINASIADTYGPQRTASVVSFVNMVAQFAGATGLAISGYAGMSLSALAGNALAEYRGIWLSAMAGVAIMSSLGMAMQWRARVVWRG